MPCGYTKEKTLNNATVTTALKQHHGVYLHACKQLGVHRFTLSQFVKENGLQGLVDQLRIDWVEDTCDVAENTITILMRDTANVAVALKAAMYFLNNQGKKRNYAHPDSETNDTKMTPAQALALADILQEERARLLKMAGKNGAAKKIRRRKKKPCEKK